MSPSDFAPQLRRAGIDLRSYAGTHTLLVETVSRDNTAYSEEAFETGLAYDWYEQFSISPDYRGERPWEAKKEE